MWTMNVVDKPQKCMMNKWVRNGQKKVHISRKKEKEWKENKFIISFERSIGVCALSYYSRLFSLWFRPSSEWVKWMEFVHSCTHHQLNDTFAVHIHAHIVFIQCIFLFSTFSRILYFHFSLIPLSRCASQFTQMKKKKNSLFVRCLC